MYRIAIRTLLKNRVFSLINVIGLAVGLACFLLIAAWLTDELSYDRYPVNAGRIYRMGVRLAQNGGIADYPDVDVAVGPGVREAISQVEAETRVSPLTTFLKLGDQVYKEPGLAIADSNFLSFFSIPLVEGDARTALTQPNSLVITRSLERKYFKGGSGLGQSLLMGFRQLKVTGVIDDLPARSHFHFDGFVSVMSFPGMAHGQTWSNIGSYTYVLLRPGADPAAVERQFVPLVEEHVVPETQHDMGVSLAEAKKSVENWHFYLMPLTDIHLHGHTKYELEANGDIQYVYIFACLAVFILLLACVNFTNLSTASAAKRSREIGIRKVLGSIRRTLVTQFLSESMVLTCCAMLLAFGLVVLLLPWFDQVSGKHIGLGYFLGVRSILFGLAVTVSVGLLAGVYPAFFLSGFGILTVLRGSAVRSRRSPLRSTLVVFQFVVSTSLIIATLVVYRQLYYMQHKKLGYDKERVLFIQDAYGLGQNLYAFKQTLLSDSRVSDVSISPDAPVDRSGSHVDGTEIYAKTNRENENASEIHGNIFHVDYDYVKTMRMTIVEGRNLSRDFPSGDSTAVVINEAAVRDLGFKSDKAALNQFIVGSGQRQWQIVGVVQDFNYTSARQKIAPLLMMLGYNNGGVLVRINNASVIDAIHRAWDGFNPRTPFSYYFLDDRFAALYSQEQKTGQIFTLFAGIAIVIASLGLFGLVAFTTEQRTKEIGIRKVLGASTSRVVLLLSQEFLALVTVALVIAIPVTWLAMHRWLENFAYRTGLGWWIFALAAVAALGLALATISFRAIRAATANPVKSLRTE